MMKLLWHWFAENKPSPHEWMLIAATLALTVVASKLPVLWQLLRVQPKHLNTWILQARLANAENNLKMFFRLRKDLRYFIWDCVRSVAILLGSLTSILLFALMRFATTPENRKALRWPGYLFVFFAYAALLLWTRQTKRISDAVRSGDHAETQLTAKRNSLREQLIAKGILTEDTSVEDSH